MSIKSLLAELQRDYVAGLPAKISLLQDLWRENKLDELTVEFHKLKGTGRTYGLPEVSQIGQALEALLEMKHPGITTAVPAALYLLDLVRAQRVQGKGVVLEEQNQYKNIIQLLQTAQSDPSNLD